MTYSTAANYKFIKRRYLKKSSKPSFCKFTSSMEAEITARSSIPFTNSLELQNYWIRLYNKTACAERPGSPLKKRSKQTSDAFKRIYRLAKEQKNADNRLITSATKAVGRYATRSVGLLLNQHRDLSEDDEEDEDDEEVEEDEELKEDEEDEEDEENEGEDQDIDGKKEDDDLLQFQFDLSCNNITTHIDTLKYNQKDKSSFNYQLLCIVEVVVRNFKKWKGENDAYSETTYLRKFEEILDLLIDDTDLFAADGENISESTRDAMLINDYECGSDYGRRLDLLIKSVYLDKNIELCSCEFKKATADDSTVDKQQSKNIRINSCILNAINSLTKCNNDILGLDWVGRDGYLFQQFRFKDIFISQHIAALHIPKGLLELDDFRSTLMHLYTWKSHNMKLSNIAKKSVFTEKRKFALIVSSCESDVVIQSPPRSPSTLPVNVFMTPTRKT